MLKSYLIKNGTLVSILDGSEKKADILVEDGIINRIDAEIEPTDAMEVFDAAGMYVSIGWLDSHTHFAGVTDPSALNVTSDLLMQGVTYAIDPGSVGPYNYEEGREKLAHITDLRYKTYLNVGNYGGKGSLGRGMDFEGPQDIDPDMVKKIAVKYRREIIGLKARIDEKFCWDPIYVMEQMRKLGDELNLRIAVHAPRSRIGIENLLPYLKNGDILCHTLAGNSPDMMVLDENGRIRQCVLDARDRGVILDLSHGTNAYSYETAETCYRAGFFVDTISSDLHGGNVNGSLRSLAVVLTKMKGLTGKPWSWILEKTIAAPVRLIGLKDKAVEITEGMTADLTVYKLEQGAFTYPDSKKAERTFSEKIAPIYTCIGTHVYTCRE